MNIEIGNMTWNEVGESIRKSNGIIVPIGAFEEHGPHLPLITDAALAWNIAKLAAEKAKFLVMPSLFLGVCRTTRMFPGTVSLKFDTLKRLIEDILEELASQGFRKIILFSWHAGKSHIAALREAAFEMKLKKHDLDVYLIVSSELWNGAERILDTKPFHAGELETSLMLVLCPELVKMDKAVKEYPPIPPYRIKTTGKPWMQSGVMGDATMASEEKGKRILKLIVTKLVDVLESF
ncbi:MAG: creatininase family protein [Candidatus Hodarchaeota archaeon]